MLHEAHILHGIYDGSDMPITELHEFYFFVSGAEVFHPLYTPKKNHTLGWW